MADKQYSDDEIDLRDYIEVILKRKKIILTIFLICVITTTVVSFWMPKVYESSAIIKIGSIIQPLISKEEATIKLQGEALLNSVIQNLKLDVDIFELKKIIKTENIKNTNLLNLKIQYSNLQLAIKICNTIADSFIQQNKEIYEKRLFLIKEEINRLGKRNEIIEQEIEKLNQTVSSQTINPDFPLMQNTLSNYETIFFQLNERIYSLRKELIDSQQFEVFEPAVTAQKIKPNKKLNIAISAILGLMLGVFVAFFREFWEKGKKT